MATGFTDILKLALPVQGELSGTWGTTVNDNITTMIEEAIAGSKTINTWVSNSATLSTADGTTAEARAAILNLTDTTSDLTGAATLICPALTKVYIVKNATGQAVTIQPASASGIAIPTGTTGFVYCDGTNVVEAINNITGNLNVGGNLTVTGTATISGSTLTANTAFVPDAADGATLGTSALEFSDLFLADGGVINFGNDQDITLTHTADTSLTLGGLSTGSTTGLIINNIATDGDPFLSFALSGTQTFTMGIDDGDSDKFKIGTTAIGTNTRFSIDSSGGVDVAGALTAGGRLITDDATEATSTTDGSLQTDGGLSVVKDVILGNDVKLLSDSAVLSLGAGSDITFTHDGTAGLTIAATPISIDSTGEFHLNSTTGDIKLQSGGVNQIAFDLDGTSGEVIMKPAVDSDDLVISQYDGTEVIRIEDNASLGLVGNKLNIANSSSDVIFKPLTDAKDVILQQYDGNEVVRIADDRRLYFFDKGGEYIYGDGTDLHIVSGADINIPANIGLTFGDDGEKIEGDGTDLTISGNNINLTATADVNIPSGVGLTFATAEKIESDGTDLSITVGSGGDINVPANIGMTFGDDGEKIEGDGTDLTISASADLNLTAATDINIPSGVGLTFGDDGEKIEGDGTDLTIASSNDINVTVGDNSATAFTIKQGSDAYLIVDTANSSESVSVGTGISGTAITLGHSTSEVTVADNLTVTGDLTINGTTTTVNSTTVTVDDPIFTLGGDTAPGSDDNKDRGIEFRYHDGSARVGFFGYDDSASAFTFLTAASNSSEVFSGTAGNLAGVGTIASGAITSSGIVKTDDATEATSTTDGSLQTDGGLSVAKDAILGNDLKLLSDSAVLVFGAGSDATITHTNDVGLTLNSTNKLMFNDPTQFIQGSSATVLSIAATDEIDLTATAVDLNGTLDVSGTTTAVAITASGLVTAGAKIDMNGTELILDADADTSITADTDDQIDIRIAGADDFQFTANTFTAQSGSTIAAQALTATTITASGIVKTDDTTDATTATDGSLQTDGGLSVAKDAILGNDLKLLSDASVLSFGTNSEVTLTHVHNDGLLLNTDMQLQFRDNAINIRSDADGDLDINADDEIELNSTLIDINGNVEISGTTTQTGISTSTAKDVFNAGMSIKNGATGAGFIEFFEDSDNGTNKVTMVGPASTGDITLTLPSTAGTVATTASAADEATALAIALG